MKINHQSKRNKNFKAEASRQWVAYLGALCKAALEPQEGADALFTLGIGASDALYSQQKSVSSTTCQNVEGARVWSVVCQAYPGALVNPQM